MFPYPSGSLHLGHSRVYTIVDTLARSHRLAGFEVLNPMGWDAFGLPAENAAIERNVKPSVWTEKNIEQMKHQMIKMGYQFDWDKEIKTCDPSYYRWTQWIFLQLFKAGLIYRKESYVNWDPVDQTVLANEQVDSQRRSWRSGAIVEKKLMNQWYIKISDYAETLLDGLTELPEWPEKVKKMQSEWIGRKEGYHISFKIAREEGEEDSIKVFTTRPDTIYGCSFIALAPDHPNAEHYLSPELKDKFRDFCQDVLNESVADRTKEKAEKKAFFSGLHAIHPLTEKPVPIYFANYIVGDYGTGAVMGVPAHDARDYMLAQKCNVSIIPVIEKPENEPFPYVQSGKIIHSEAFDGMESVEMVEQLKSNNEAYPWFHQTVTYNLKDWLISRQRYWGTPIPVIHCPNCGTLPVPEENLPVTLPTDVELLGKGSPLNSMESFTHVKCHECGHEDARRETETMDTFVDSSWYFLRYPDAKNDKEIFNEEIVDNWLPVDVYVGGVEHSILHLLYARFINRFLYDEGLLNYKEPFSMLRTQGMVLGKTYRETESDKPIPSTDVEYKDDKPFHAKTGKELFMGWEKMSKSKYNGTDPIEVVKDVGADVVRLGLLFRAPIDLDLEWDPAHIEGQKRWLKRIWTLIQHFKLYQYYKMTGKIEDKSHMQAIEQLTEEPSERTMMKEEKKLRKLLHETISLVTRDIFEQHAFNKAIANMMKFSNDLVDLLEEDGAFLTKKFDHTKMLETPLFEESLKNLLIMLAPMAPHFASEAWCLYKVNLQVLEMNESVDIFNEEWPEFNPDYVEEEVEEEIDFNVHVNGKFRGVIQVPQDLEDDLIIQHILGHPHFEKYTKGKELTKSFVKRDRKAISVLLEEGEQ